MPFRIRDQYIVETLHECSIVIQKLDAVRKEYVEFVRVKAPIPPRDTFPQDYSEREKHAERRFNTAMRRCQRIVSALNGNTPEAIN